MLNKLRKRTRTLILVFIIYIFITISFTILYDKWPIFFKYSIFKKDSFYSSFITNMYSSIFDFVLISFILWFFNQRHNEEDKIKRYHENIEDYRFWMNEIATYKIWGNVRRLYALDIRSFDLSKCMLNHIKLKGMNFTNSKLMGSYLHKSNLKSGKFVNCDFQGAQMEEAKLNNANFLECNCKYLNLKKAHLKSFKAHNSKFIKAKFINADLNNAEFKNCDFEKADFKNANLERANLKGAKNLTKDQLLSCESIKYLSLDSKFYDDNEIKIRTKKIPPSSNA